jgi:outer membrane biosynthesis protein TonB
MKEKKQVIRGFGIVILILGCLLAANSMNVLTVSAFDSPIPQPTGEPTSIPTDEPTTEPTAEPTTEPTPEAMVLRINGPASMGAEDTAQLTVDAQGLSGNGLYGAQLEILFDPNLLSIGNLQVNPDLPYVLQNNADNSLGKITLVASRQGRVPGLTGNITLLTFQATALGIPGTATLSFEGVKMGDPQALPLALTIENFTLLIEDNATPVPTDEPTPIPTDEPTPLPTDEPTPVPTDEPTVVPTDEPTPIPTDEPTPLPTDEPTPIPTDEPTPVPTDEPTPVPTDEPTPVPTDEPGLAVVSGQVILAGRANSDWSGGTVTIDDTGQSANTDPTGNFIIADVAPGAHSSITADGPGYLPAVCTTVTITAPETALAIVNLLSGDISDDGQVDITDATAIGTSFGQTGTDLPADINRDGIIDIFDLILVGVNFGEETQPWNCLAR